MPDKILLGRILGAHGIRGEVTISSFAEDVEGIAGYGPLTDATGRKHVIEHLRATPKGLIARLAGVRDRNAAEALRGVDLFVDRDALPETDEDEFYFEDLVGLAAFAPDGERLGEVVAIQNYGAGDLVELRVPQSRATELIPFTKLNVPEVDIAGRRLTIVRPTYAPDDRPVAGGASQNDTTDETGDETV
jgi:16S rRNA processing protein RimM